MKFRLAVRAAILDELDRVLMVNAYPGQRSDLWGLPGGGAEPDQTLSDNLIREVFEETGLTVTPGAPILVNEFHSDARGIRQVDIIFRAEIVGSTEIRMEDPEGIVNRFRWVSREEITLLRHKPDRLPLAVWGSNSALHDPDEPIVE